MSKRSQWTIFYLLPVLLWMSLVFTASTESGDDKHTRGLILQVFTFFMPNQVHSWSPTTVDAVDFYTRKTAHVTEYLVLTLLAVRAAQFLLPQQKRRAAYLAWCIGFLYACTDEYHQTFVPTRTGQFKDVLVDSIGITLALGCVLLWIRRQPHSPSIQSTKGDSTHAS